MLKKILNIEEFVDYAKFSPIKNEELHIVNFADWKNILQKSEQINIDFDLLAIKPPVQKGFIIEQKFEDQADSSFLVEDISAVVDYLSALPYVEEDRIGAAGICAGGGYSVNIGAMYRNGWEGDIKDTDALPLLMIGGDVRAKEAQKQEGRKLPFAPETRESAPNKEMEDAWEYYRTPRAMCSTAPGYLPARSLTQLVTYDAFNFAEAFLVQPIQIIVGSESGCRWMSEDIYNRAASTNKHIHVVNGANHMELYDIPQYVEETVSVIVPFFLKNL